MRLDVLSHPTDHALDVFHGGDVFGLAFSGLLVYADLLVFVAQPVESFTKNFAFQNKQRYEQVAGDVRVTQLENLLFYKCGLIGRRDFGEAFERRSISEVAVG